MTVAEFLDKARRKLVDTSMRNRLLNYVGGKRSSAVEIISEQPAPIWTALVDKKRKLRFRGTEPEAKSDEDQATLVFEEVRADNESDEGDQPLADAFESAHLDEFIDIRMPGDALSTKLRKLADGARLAAEEQGVETLFMTLGFLHYFEAESSEQERRAPLILVPAKLERVGTDRWSVKASDDEPLVNPALAEYLGSQHGLRLPELTGEGFEPQQWFTGVATAIARRQRWRVSATCLVGNFSFQKFVMHEDLKKNAVSIAGHEIVGLLSSRAGGSAGVSQLPTEIRDLDLDARFTPEGTLQVVDADSTQQRALAAVATGKNLVIQGPPGTGKSQTITNLIASALADGKTVLFVAEKQAALNVVCDRLKKAGLGDFCLELHSTKANKKALLQELKRAWDASIQQRGQEPTPPPTLPQVRTALSAYSIALHTNVEPFGRTPFFVMGRLLALQQVPDLRIAIVTKGVTGEKLKEAVELLKELGDAANGLGGPFSEHAWFGATLNEFSLERREGFFDALDELHTLLPTVEEAALQAEAAFGVALRSLDDGSALVGPAASIIAESPGVPREVTGATDSQFAATTALSVIERVRSLRSAEEQTRGILLEPTNVEALASSVEVIVRRGRSIFAWLSSAWRAARRQIKSAVQKASWAGAFATAVAVAKRLEVERQRLALGTEAEPQRFFGSLWKGVDSDPGELAKRVDWVRRFREAFARLGLRASVLEVVAKANPDVSPLKELGASCERALVLLTQLRESAGWPSEHLRGASLWTVREFVDRLHNSRESWRDMERFLGVAGKARSSIAAPAAEVAIAGQAAWDGLPAAFEKRFLRLWLDEIETRQPTIGRFNGEAHATKIAQFRALDHQALETNKNRVAYRLRRRTSDGIERAPGEATVLRDQLARMRGHLPARQLVQRAFGAIRAIKPCFLMSPMAVAQTLSPDHVFDLVVFDEASQLTTEDALGAVARGKQLVVVGDPKQLPPTNFFSVQLGEVESDEEVEGELKLQDMESILELAQASGFPGAQLRWHYRSRHESLIAYSNRHFYDSSLLTFPGPERASGAMGLSFEFVQGQYEGRGLNTLEARRVAEAVVEHARQFPDRSLGVGTFSVAQQTLIQDLLENLRQSDPALDGFMDLDKLEPFFVKNLESIQGDERDVIFLSVTYGPGVDGKIRYNFGPLGNESGWRRLNVLTTRARQQMKVFGSMRADEMQVDGSKRGATLLRDFLRYAETGSLVAGPLVNPEAEVESPFEAEVFRALTEAGTELLPQIGVSGYRVDFGVVDSQVPGRFVCGLECDGATYHSAESARDRDRLREEVLRGLGWELHRVWSTDWWHDPQRETRRLLSLIEQSRNRARTSPPVTLKGANSSGRANQAAPQTQLPVPAGPLVARRVPQVPTFVPYRVASLHRQRGDLVDASSSTLSRLCREVLEQEGPIHEDLLRARLLQAFDHQRAGLRIVERLDRELLELQGRNGLVFEQNCWHLVGAPIVPRFRSAVEQRPEQIPPREYCQAVILALRLNESLTEAELVPVLRDAFGFAAATSALKASVEAALRALVQSREVLQGSNGYLLNLQEQQ